MELPGEKMYMCGACGKSFRRCDNMKSHMAIHTGARPFKCTLCNKSFRARGHLNTHLLIHTGEKPFKCNDCGKQFNQSSNLTKHMKLHIGYRPYACEVCSQKFTQLCYLKEHMKGHTGEREFECSKCPKKFKNSNQLKAHLMSHSHEKPYKCTICNKYFKYSKNYIVHKMAHENEIVCYCSECGKELRSENALKRHKLLHVGVQLHECMLCGKEFKAADNLKKHLKVHSEEKPFQCEVCGKNFRSQSNLKSHMIFHSLQYPYSCLICGKKFKYKNNHIRHMKGHTGEYNYSCTICDAVFTCKSSLDIHRLVHLKIEEVPLMQSSTDVTICEPMEDEDLEHVIHNIVAVDHKDESIIQGITELEGKTPFECHICGKEYTTNGNLKLHMRNHTGERPYKCSICSKDFTQSSLLKVHMRTHTNERPYTCSICQKKFKHSSHMHTHVRSHGESNSENQPDLEVSMDIPLGEPVNSCDICGKTFLRKYILKRHMLVHSDERAFNCDQCGKKFKESSHLKAHIMLHTGERPYDCNVCGKKFIQRSDQKRHMRTHAKQPSKGRPFTCTVCGLKFAYVHNLETHKIIHAMRKNKHCEEEFITDSNNSGNNYIDESYANVIVDKGKLEDASLVVSEHEVREVVYETIIEDRDGHDHRQVVYETIEEDGEGQEQNTGELVLNSGNENSECMEQPVKGHNMFQNVELVSNPLVVKEKTIKKIQVYSSKSSSSLESSFENKRLIIDSHEHKEPHKSTNDAALSAIPRYSYENISENQEHAGDTSVIPTYEQPCSESNTSGCFLKPSNLANGKSNTSNSNVYDTKQEKLSMKKFLPIHRGMDVTKDFNIVECPVCNKKFNRTFNLKRHMLVHSGERPFCCSLCGKRFKEKGHLKTHKLLVHTDERPYQCTICGKRTALKSDHMRHVQFHKGERPFTCTLCGNKFTTKRNMETHKIIHAMKKNRASDSCKRQSVSDTSSYNEGSTVMDDFALLSCTESRDLVQKSGTSVSRHHVIHISDKPQSHLGYENSLSELSKNYISIQTYTRGSASGLQGLHNINDFPAESQSQHVVKIYSTDTPKHIVRVRNEEESTISNSKSPVSDLPGTDIIKLEPQEVQRNIFEPIEPIMEVQIGKITVKAIPYELARERNRMVSAGGKGIECTVCGHTFSTNHNLKVHMRIHTGDRPFMCEICGKKFSQKSNLRMHMKCHLKKSNTIQ